MIAAYKRREAAAAHSAHALPTAPPAPPCTGGAPTSQPPRTPRRMGRLLRILPGVRQRATASASTPCVCPRQLQEPLCFYAVLNTARRTRIKCARLGRLSSAGTIGPPLPLLSAARQFVWSTVPCRPHSLRTLRVPLRVPRTRCRDLSAGVMAVRTNRPWASDCGVASLSSTQACWHLRSLETGECFPE